MSDEYKKEFEAILAKDSWWVRLVGSQFVTMLSTFVGQMVYKAEYAASRYLQEAFISRAAKRSSILAAAEDKGYVGRKKMPSTGDVEITNNTNETVSIPVNTPLISDASIQYVVLNAVEIGANTSVVVPVAQLELRQFSSVVSSADKYIEVMLTKAVSQAAHDVDVRVSSGGASFLWQKSYMFRRSTATSKVYTEFYTPTEQLGIRFGNGVNGLIPPVGSTITLDVWVTDGETTLIDGQALTVVGNRADLNNSVDIVTVTPIVGGEAAESDEETRAGALYTTPYDNQIVWDDDYIFFIKQNLANIVWVNAWGEQQQEAQNGVDIDNINRVFVSAFSSLQDDEELGADVAALLASTGYLNKKWTYVSAVERPFTVTITATATGDKDLVSVKKVIEDALEAVYGRIPTQSRPEYILEKDVNQLVRDLNLLYDFSIRWAGFPTGINLEDYVYLDVQNSTIDITYKVWS